MIEKIVGVITYTAITFLGLAALPYLLWRAWDNRIPFKRKGRGLDLDCRG